jgi:hypothetical protein
MELSCALLYKHDLSVWVRYSQLDSSLSYYAAVVKWILFAPVQA